MDTIPIGGERISYLSGPHADGRTSQIPDWEERFMRGPNGTPLPEIPQTDILDDQSPAKLLLEAIFRKNNGNIVFSVHDIRSLIPRLPNADR